MPRKTTTPPAAGIRTASSTSSTDSAVSCTRHSTTSPSYVGSATAFPAGRSGAGDRDGPDQRDGGTGGGAGGVLALQPRTVSAGPLAELVEVRAQRGGVVPLRRPPGSPQPLRVDD